MKSHINEYWSDRCRLTELCERASYVLTIKAIDFAEPYHSGFRKDHKTPNFHHQIQTALSLYDERRRLMWAKLNVDETLCEGILHDTPEENDNIIDEIEGQFKSNVAYVCNLLNKKRIKDNPYRDDPSELAKIFSKETMLHLERHNWNVAELNKMLHYCELLVESPNAIIVKLHDRRNNIHTVLGLPPKKQVKYIMETRLISIFAKKAIARYPRLDGLINQSRRSLKNAMDMYRITYEQLYRDLTAANIPLTGRTGEIVTSLSNAGLISLPNVRSPNLVRDRSLQQAAHSTQRLATAHPA